MRSVERLLLGVSRRAEIEWNWSGSLYGSLWVQRERGFTFRTRVSMCNNLVLAFHLSMHSKRYEPLKVFCLASRR
jgi:hypothetical protein